MSKINLFSKTKNNNDNEEKISYNHKNDIYVISKITKQKIIDGSIPCNIDIYYNNYILKEINNTNNIVGYYLNYIQYNILKNKYKNSKILVNKYKYICKTKTCYYINEYFKYSFILNDNTNNKFVADYPDLHLYFCIKFLFTKIYLGKNILIEKKCNLCCEKSILNISNNILKQLNNNK